MENNGSGLTQRALVNELLQGRDLAKKLQYVLVNEPSSSSNGTRELMMKNIVASFEKAIGISQSSDLMYQSSQRTLVGTIDSPNSYSGSPKSQDSKEDLKDPEYIRDGFRKRKHFIPQETKRVEGCSSTGLEGPVEDGCSWRKYGQKDILGARYPRAYYRCTHRVKGCMATKQVQRCDDDPTFFMVSYRGKHTCIQASSFNSSDIIKPEPTQTQIHDPYQQKSSQIMLSFTDKEDHDIKPFNSPSNKLLKSMSTSFSFSSNLPNPIVSTQKAPETSFGNFSTNMNTFQQSFPSLSNTMHGFNNQLGIHSQGGIVREVAPTTSTSPTNHDSPATASDFSFAQGEFDQNIMFDSPNLFP